MHGVLAQKTKDDYAAIALVNAILAHGCRLVLSKRTGNSILAREEAQKYFMAAMNVRSELAGVQPTVSTIQVNKSSAMIIS